MKSKSHKPPVRRRWFQFSMRGLLLGFVATAIVMGWVCRRVRNAGMRAEVTGKFTKVQGRVTYDSLQRGPLSAAAANWLGEDFVDDAVALSMPIRKVGPRYPICLEGLEYCSQLREVGLASGAESDENLARLSHARGLTKLCVYGNITDRGLSPLAELENLRVIRLYSVSYPPAKEALSTLPRSPDLAELDLIGFPLDKKLIERISRYRNLSWLRLEGAGLTDKDLRPLARLEHLRHLDLSSNPIRGHGLTILPWLPNLVELHLGGTEVKEEAFAWIAQCPRLEMVRILGERFAEGSIQAFRAAHPKLAVDTFVATCGIRDDTWFLLDWRRKPW